MQEKQNLMVSAGRVLLAPFGGPYLYGLLILAALLVGAVYQLGGHYRWDMGDKYSEVYLSGFYGMEQANGVGFRWTRPSAAVQAPGVGSFDGTARFRLYGDDWGDPPRQATLRVNDSQPVSFQLQSGWHEYEFPLTRAALWSGDMSLRLTLPAANLPPGRRGPQDTRRLGVPVQWVTVDRTGRWSLPSLSVLVITLALVMLVYMHAVWTGVRPRTVAWTVMGLVLGWVASLAAWRLPLAVAAPGLLVALAAGVALSLGLRPLLTRLFRRAGVQILSIEWRWLASIFILGLVFKATGLLDPMFQAIDHYARLHRLMEFGNDPLYFLQHFLDADRGQTYAGQLGLSAVVPYSPLFYIVFSPLNWLVPDPDTRLQAINLVCSAVEASNVFLLFYVIKRAWGDGMAGIWAGAMFVAFPLTNLLFSDGGYPGILANWLLMLFIAALAWGYPQLQRLPVLAALGALLALALLAHTANALLLGATLFFFLAGVWVLDRARFGAVLRWATTGLVVAFVAFYVNFTQTAVDLLAQILNKLQATGGVGKAEGKGHSQTLSGFWPQITAHFLGWPVLLAAPALWLRSGNGGWLPKPAAPGGVQGESALADADPVSAHGLTLWLGATGVTFALFSIGDIWVNMLQKHMIYVMPAIALLDGLALARLWRRGRLARLLCVALWASVFTASLVIWINRVVWYILPPGSG